MKLVPYALHVGSLIYAKVATRPDSSHGRSGTQIHVQSWLTTLDCSEAYLQVFSGHTRPWHPFRTEQNFGLRRVYRLGGRNYRSARLL